MTFFKVKPKKGVFFGGLALFLCLFVLPCYAATANTILQGKVYEQGTSKALPKAITTLYSYRGSYIGSTRTNEAGRYILSKNFPSGIYRLSCSLAGYQSKSGYFYFSRGRTYSINFSLKALPVNQPPQILEVNPKNLSSLYGGETLKLSIQAKDPDSDRPLEYRFLMDGKVLQGWSQTAEFSLPTTNSYEGRHKIQFEARDSHGAIAAKQSDIYIYFSMPGPFGN